MNICRLITANHLLLGMDDGLDHALLDSHRHSYLFKSLFIKEPDKSQYIIPNIQNMAVWLGSATFYNSYESSLSVSYRSWVVDVFFETSQSYLVLPIGLIIIS